MTDTAFEPSTVCGSTAQTLVIQNASGVPIEFTVQRDPSRGGNVPVAVPPGEQRTLGLSGFDPGNYNIEDTLHNSVPRAATLIVVSP